MLCARFGEAQGGVSSLEEVCASAAEGCLVKEAKKWATKAAKDYKIITHGERALQMLGSRLKLLSGETGLSVEQKIAEVQDNVRKAKHGTRQNDGVLITPGGRQQGGIAEGQDDGVQNQNQNQNQNSSIC
ncbi:unnamed protein product [Pleuronectes platessa]|uniref:Uncharacterized protein n=1 Tax=Pleuronectes platessa TaxID=8262 RepID=A0A9N7UQT1_PLEPL|nr:unnamed protein product [Pleuronectes platessa]